MRTLTLVLLALVLAGGVFAACSPPQHNNPAPAATQTSEPSPTPTSTATAVPTPTQTPVPTATPTATPTPTATAAPSPTPAPSSTPTAPVIVEYQVIWTKVEGLDPSTIPVEEGFYNGSFPGEYSFSPGSKEPGHEGARFAWRVLPQLKGNQTARVAATRDPYDKSVVLASIEADANLPHLLLSVDGEKSWCEINNQLPIPDTTRVYGIADLRVLAEDNTIYLYVQDGRLGIHWWVATIRRSDLPCS